MNLKSIVNELNSDNIKIEETFHNLNISILFNSIFVFKNDWLNKFISIIHNRDVIFSFTLKYDDFEEIKFNDNISDFIGEQKDIIDLMVPTKSTEINIEINKGKDISIISIYFLDEFSDYINISPISEVLTNLYSKFKNDFITFEIIDDMLQLNKNSNAFIVKSIISNNSYNYIADNSLKENFKSVCCFLGKSDLIFTPNDFNIDISENHKFNNIFKKLKIIFSIIYISDISSLTQNNLNIKLNGYKNIELNIDINTLDLDKLLIYYDIYEWIYTDGNISDKIGIARNIISLYLINYNTIELHNSVLTAIKSNYSIYLKENVEKYMDLKTKVIDNLFETNSQISELINSLTQNFMKNLTTILTFIFTITIMNSLNDKRLTNIFTTEITIVSLFLIIASALYLKYTINEYKENKERIISLYTRLKQSYTDIIIIEDINSLFNNDQYFNEDIQKADKKMIKYKRYWLISLVMFGILVIILGIIIKIRCSS